MNPNDPTANPQPSLGPPSTFPRVDYRDGGNDPRLKYVHAKRSASKPRCLVTIYGITTIPKSIDVTMNAHGVADTATIVLGIAGNPEWSTMLKNPVGEQGAVSVEIHIGFPVSMPRGSTDTTQLTRIFIGTVVPGYELQASTDTATFQCISLASLMMVERQTTLTQGMTTVDFVTQAAKLVGLQVDIRLRGGSFDPHAKAVTGAQKPLLLREVMAQDRVVGIKNVPLWTLAESCAEADDVELFVDRNGVLRYIAPELHDRKVLDVHYGQSLIDLTLAHSPQFNKNIKIRGKLWNRHTKTTHSVTVVTGPDGHPQVTSRTRVSTSVPQWGTPDSETTSTSYDPKTGKMRTTTGSTHSSGGLVKINAPSIPRESSGEFQTMRMQDISIDEANRRVLNEWLRRSRFEYSVTMHLPIGEDTIDVLAIDTVGRLFGCPWHAFNTAATMSTPGQVAAAGLGSGVKATQFQSDAPYYFFRRTNIKFSAGDGETSEGLTASIEAVNHAIPGGQTI